VHVHVAAVVALLVGGLPDSVAAVLDGGAVGVAVAVLAGVVRRPLIADLPAGDHAIAADRLAVGARRQEPGQGEVEVRLNGVPLGVEEEDLVDVPGSDREAGVPTGVERHGRRLRRVDPSQVDGEAAVDVDPNVVVARELQLLASLVLEEVAQLRGEVEVVWTGRQYYRRPGHRARQNRSL
jgi:hypothetical protein